MDILPYLFRKLFVFLVKIILFPLCFIKFRIPGRGRVPVIDRDALSLESIKNNVVLQTSRSVILADELLFAPVITGRLVCNTVETLLLVFCFL